MRASLCLKRGVLYVGCATMTAHVRAFDLDGRELDAGFSFRGPGGGRAAVDGLSIDEDHRLWVADSASASLRCFTLFGAEIARAGGGAPGATDRRDLCGALGTPIDVVSLQCDDEHRLLVASKGVRRHAVHVLPLSPAGGRTRSLRPAGEPNGRFRGLSRVASRGALVFVCEPGAGRVQVFRDGEFHYSFRVAIEGGAAFEPMAIAPLADGRLVVAQGGERSAVLLTGAGGRVLARIAGPGSGEGEVLEPSDLALEEGADDARSRLAVIDFGGERVQVFNLAGRCYGAFPGLDSAARESKARARGPARRIRLDPPDA